LLYDPRVNYRICLVQIQRIWHFDHAEAGVDDRIAAEGYLLQTEEWREAGFCVENDIELIGFK
jgi:hypothetical protein